MIAQIVSIGSILSAYGVFDTDNVLYSNDGNTIHAFALNTPFVPLLGIGTVLPGRGLPAAYRIQTGQPAVVEGWRVAFDNESAADGGAECAGQ